MAICRLLEVPTVSRYQKQRLTAIINGQEKKWTFFKVSEVIVDGNAALEGTMEGQLSSWRFIIFTDNNVGAAIMSPVEKEALAREAKKHWIQAHNLDASRACC